MKNVLILISVAILLAAPVMAADNLKLNQHLDYSSDSHDGPLITADHLEDGVVAGKPAYLIIYGEGCFNSKRQARRTVDLYEKYRDRVQFVVVDLDQKLSSGQRELVTRFYKGYIPHVVLLDRDGRAVYNASGEVEEKRLSEILDRIVQ
jgi:hypothetical protein